MSQKPQSYKVQFLRYEVRQSFSSFWAIFCPFNPLPLNNPKNQNFGGMKKEFGDVIILNLCNKKHDHMMYAYSDVGYWHRHDFVSFQVIFCSFAPLLTLKIKVWKKHKKTPGDNIFFALNLVLTHSLNFLIITKRVFDWQHFYEGKFL